MLIKISVFHSAGTGRTGLFIMADILNKILPIEAKVSELMKVPFWRKETSRFILFSSKTFRYCNHEFGDCTASNKIYLKIISRFYSDL